MSLISNAAKSVRSGLARLRNAWQQNGCLRHVVCGLLGHVVLLPPVVAVLLLCGVPQMAADVIGLVCALIAAYAVEKGVDTKLGA